MENKEIKKNGNAANLAGNDTGITKNERDSIMESKENKLVENKPENSVKTGTTSVQSMTLEEAIRIFKSSKPKEKALEDAPKSTEVPEKDAEKHENVSAKNPEKGKEDYEVGYQKPPKKHQFQKGKVEILLGVRKSQSLDH